MEIKFEGEKKMKLALTLKRQLRYPIAKNIIDRQK